MKSRRSFIAKTTMATTALLATKPFQALAGLSNSFNSIGASGNHMVYLHAGDATTAFAGKTGRYISDIRSNAVNNILMHTGKTADSSRFDTETGSTYQVIQKGEIKTGVFYITAGETDAAAKMNKLARLLKEDENCQVVVCISHLSHKSKSGMDNLQLAALSEQVDLIIGNDSSNPAPKTMVVANKNRKEVLLQYSKHKDMDCAKVEFTFNSKGEKRHVHVATKLYKHSLA